MGPTTGIALLLNVSRNEQIAIPSYELVTDAVRTTPTRDSNDTRIATPINEFADFMRQLLLKAQSVAPTAVMTGYPFDETRTQPYRDTNVFYCLDDAREYTEKLIEVAGSLDVKVLDFFDKFQGTDMTPFLAPDGLHGNSECRQRLFEMTDSWKMNTAEGHNSQRHRNCGHARIQFIQMASLARDR